MAVMEEINRKQILDCLLEIVEIISDREYQKKAWIEVEGPGIADIDEICCLFFGDADPLLEDYEKFPMTHAQYMSLKNFRDKFREFSDENDFPVLFINTPEWDKIIEIAEEVLKAFNYKKKRS